MKKLLSLFTLSLCFLSFSMKVNALSTLVNSDFEVSDPTVWTLSNAAATNQWFIGTAAFSTGVRSAYITSDAGVTNSYVITTTSTNHIYTSVTFPAGETAILLSFDWRGTAEPSGTGGSSFDYIRVSLMAAAPVGGTFPALAEQLPVVFTGAPGYQKAWVVIPASYAGTTNNLVLTWRNDASLGNSTPGPSIDNVLLTSATPAALSGTLTIPGSYSSFGQAIANLNAHGLGAGGVTFNVAAGSVFNETPPAITVTGTLANQIIFQKSGAGSNPLVNSTGTGNFGPTSTGSSAGGGDASIVISGGDYITFDGIDVSTGNYAGTSSCIEYGYLVRNAAVGDGAQNNVIKNCSISRNRTNTASAGIIQSISSTQGGITPTSAAGANSTNKYSNITVTNSYGGINLAGNSSFPDLSCEISNSTIGASYAGTPTGDIGGLGTATYGISNTAQSSVKIFNNTLRNIASTTTTRGILIATSLGTSEVYNNQIYGIRSLSATSTSGVNGIDASLSTAVDATLRIYNNFVYDLSSSYTSTASATRQLRGILLGSGFSVSASYNVDFNSVYVDGTGSPNISSVGLELGGSTAVNNIRNNIFVNTTGAQSGVAKHYTIRSTAVGAMGGAGSVCNNNVYYFTNTTNGYMGLTNTTDRNALSDWVTALSTTHPGIDANSWTQNPQYTSPTNLHINASLSTPVESNGSYFAGAITWVPNDIDGNSRNATTPDIGADEGTFTSLVNNDIEATAFVVPLNGGIISTGATVTPQASYSNNGLLTQNAVPVKYRILNPSNTEIYNQTGSITTIGPGATTIITFPVSGVLSTPGIYTIKSYSQLVGDQATTNDSITGTFTVKSPLAGDYTVGTALFNRVTGRNITFERIVNKVIKELPEVIQNDNKNSDAPDEVRMVKKEVEEVSWIPMENGSEYKGSLYAKRDDNSNLPGEVMAGVYATITAAVADINSVGATDSVRFLLTDVSYLSETLPITINTWPGASSTNRLIIKPNTGVTSSITGSSATGVFVIKGADYVKIDGSNGNTANTICPLSVASRDLTITNTSSSTSSAVVWLQTNVADGATNNTIKNCNLVGNSNTTTLFGVGSGSSTISTSSLGTNNNSNSYINNNISRTQYGIYSQGASIGVKNTNTVINQNLINSVSPNNVQVCGVQVGFEDGITISGNNISELTTTLDLTAIAVGIAANAIAATTTTGNEVVNATITKNIIGSVISTSTTGFSAMGITLASASTGTNLIANNMINGVNAPSTSPDFSSGIFSGGGAATTNIYYNTVSMTGTRLASTTYPSYALSINGTTPLVDVRNNILVNSQSTTGAGLSYAIGLGYTSTTGNYTNLTSNNNNLFTSGTSGSFSKVGSLAQGSGTNQTTLLAWQTETGRDGAAQSVQPVYVSFSNLHLDINNAANYSLDATAAAISVSDDIDCNVRNVSTPDIGADEFTPSGGLTLKLNWEACPNAGAVTVELRSGTSPYGLIESANGTGGGNVASLINFGNASDGTPYYVVVKSVNSVETWSATTVTFTTHAASYDFTAAISQAYGNNQKLSGGIPSVYQGDANQDGFVNTADVLLTYNNASAFITAPNTDFNCDGITDITDVILAYNNSTNFIQKQRP